MPDLHIHRTHALGLAKARQLAREWARTAEDRLEMACDYHEGKTADQVAFKRSGVTGELKVTADAFVLDAKLGFLLGAFKDRIEKEITRNLDELLARKEPLQAFRQGVADFETRRPKA